MRWATAISARQDLDAALDDAIQSLRRDFGAVRADLALLFVAASNPAAAAMLPARLQSKLPTTVLLGCTAAGVIGGGREIEHEPAVALTVAELPDTTVTPFAIAAADLPDDDAPPQAWHDASGIAPEPRPEFILLADPFSCPIERLVGGLDYAYPRSTKVGGLASAA